MVLFVKFYFEHFVRNESQCENVRQWSEKETKGDEADKIGAVLLGTKLQAITDIQDHVCDIITYALKREIVKCLVNIGGLI